MSKQQSDLRKISYRPEIDGLRAVSVLGVVLFHFQLGFPGGYVGVDVFFVISGFLITSIISREIESGSFTLRNFWTRRIRRIFPAVSLLTISVLIAGVIILDPAALENLARSAVAQTLMVSNVFFWRDAGYFTEAAELKPLLHTWSLSIEEQFYVFLPLAMLLLTRCSKRSLVPVLILTLLLSLGLSIYGVFRSPGATFYLLPTRAWELLAGSVAALAFRNLTLSNVVANLVSGLGILLVVVPMLLYSSETRFPGALAIPPVLGAALFLIANTRSSTFAGRILSVRPLVFIGLISYSLYLWHWPLLSFSRHLLIESSSRDTVLLLVLTFALAILSWKFVETPFRTANRLRKSSSAFAFASGITVLLLIVGSCLISTKGIPSRFDDETSQILEDVHWSGSEYKEEIGDPIGRIRFGKETESTPDFVLWGDSHAMVLGPIVEELSVKFDLAGVAFISPATPPVPGLWMPREISRRPEDVLAQNEERMRWILENEVKQVILVARWDTMYSPQKVFSTAAGTRLDPEGLMVTDAEATALTREESIAALKRQLSAMARKLAEHEVRVSVLMQVPELFISEVADRFSRKHRFPNLNSSLPVSRTTIKEYREQRAESLAVFAALAPYDVEIIDPIQEFFPGNDPVILYGSRAFYRDNNHLTRAGVEHYLVPVLSEVFEQWEKDNK